MRSIINSILLSIALIVLGCSNNQKLFQQEDTNSSDDTNTTTETNTTQHFK
ncbi:MAG: hypothetical protein IE887_11330 [Campylobacterales bacterium]|nr:hypothetical protein [Campylobacterales bacterium]